MDRQASSESVFTRYGIAFGQTGVERESIMVRRKRIWLDKRQARANARRHCWSPEHQFATERNVPNRLLTILMSDACCASASYVAYRLVAYKLVAYIQRGSAGTLRSRL